MGTKASKDKVTATNKKPPKGTSQAQARENNNRTPVWRNTITMVLIRCIDLILRRIPICLDQFSSI